VSETKNVTTVAVDPKTEAALREAIDAGVFYGRSKRNSNPRMKSTVLYTRNGMEVVNLNVTLDAMEKAQAFLAKTKQEGRTILFVGTQDAFADLINEFIEATNLASVTNRWIGGLLTNFGMVSTRIAHLKKLRSDLGSGAMDKYVKKERTMAEQELHKLEANLGSFENLVRVPDVIVVVDPSEHRTAVLEAKKLGLPVIAFGNVDAAPDGITYLIPGNVQGRKSVSWFLAKIREALERAPAPVQSAE
jgi:small subunit ribosomal protein S2